MLNAKQLEQLAKALLTIEGTAKSQANINTKLKEIGAMSQAEQVAIATANGIIVATADDVLSGDVKTVRVRSIIASNSKGKGFSGHIVVNGNLTTYSETAFQFNLHPALNSFLHDHECILEYREAEQLKDKKNVNLKTIDIVSFHIPYACNVLDALVQEQFRAVRELVEENHDRRFGTLKGKFVLTSPRANADIE